MKTLKVYFDTGANASEAADRSSCTATACYYRLSRVEKLTGLKLEGPPGKVGPQLGLLDVGHTERSADDATSTRNRLQARSPRW